MYQLKHTPKQDQLPNKRTSAQHQNAITSQTSVANDIIYHAHGAKSECALKEWLGGESKICVREKQYLPG